MDQEVWEELLAKVPIMFALSKEAARRSNLDLSGKLVQQIRGRDRLWSRSESPHGSYKREQSRARPRKGKSICFFCGDDRCFSKDESCPASGRDALTATRWITSRTLWPLNMDGHGGIWNRN